MEHKSYEVPLPTQICMDDICLKTHGIIIAIADLTPSVISGTILRLVIEFLTSRATLCARVWAA